MDRIEPIRPSLPPIDTTRVPKVSEERERRAAQREAAEREQAQRRRRKQDDEQREGREWRTFEQPPEDEDQDGPPTIDVKA
jgi:hypothetical protein